MISLLAVEKYSWMRCTMFAISLLSARNVLHWGCHHGCARATVRRRLAARLSTPALSSATPRRLAYWGCPSPPARTDAIPSPLLQSSQRDGCALVETLLQWV